MTNTGYEVLGATIITVTAVVGKTMENAGHFQAARTNRRRNPGMVSLFYECCNFHLHLSLGMLGLAWSKHWDTFFCVPLFLFILVGVAAKGVFAKDNPGTLGFFDRDAFCGLWFPNIMAAACVFWVVLGGPLSLRGESLPPPELVTEHEHQPGQSLSPFTNQ